MQSARPCVLALIHADNDNFNYMVVIIANLLFMGAFILLWRLMPVNDYSFYHLAFMVTNGFVYWVLFFATKKKLNKMVD